MKRFASVIQVASAAVLSIGVATFSVGAGLVCAGVCGVVFGVAAERGS